MLFFLQIIPKCTNHPLITKMLTFHYELCIEGSRNKRNTLCSHLPRASKYHFLICASISSYMMQLDRECNSFAAISPISCKFNHRRLFTVSTQTPNSVFFLQNRLVDALELKESKNCYKLPLQVAELHFLCKILVFTRSN